MRHRALSVSPRLAALAVAATVVVFDHLTKFWAVKALSDEPIELLGDFLALRIHRNPGAAFGLLQGAGSLLALLAIAVVVIIVLGLKPGLDRLSTISLGLVLGGATGNLADRLFRGEGFADGEVVDFIDFNFWPTFNVADSAITIGAVLALLGAIWITPASSSPPD